MEMCRGGTVDIEQRMLKMELPGRRKRPRRSFMDVAKENMQRPGGGCSGWGEMEADDLLWRLLQEATERRR